MRVLQKNWMGELFLLDNGSKRNIWCFLSSDVAIFPGSSSCLRQQAAATGLPIVICNNKADKGINININGNAYVLDEKWKESELVSAMKSILNDDIYHAKARELCCGYYKQFSYMRQVKSLIVDNMSQC